MNFVGSKIVVKMEEIKQFTKKVNFKFDFFVFQHLSGTIITLIFEVWIVASIPPPNLLII